MELARTATFLMTDIEGSTRLWEEHRAAMAVALEAHDVLLRAAVEQAGGTVVGKRPATGCWRPSTGPRRDWRQLSRASTRWSARLGRRSDRCGCGWRSTPGAQRSGTTTSSGRRSTGWRA